MSVVLPEPAMPMQMMTTGSFALDVAEDDDPASGAAEDLLASADDMIAGDGELEGWRGSCSVQHESEDDASRLE